MFTYPDGSEENKRLRANEVLWHNPKNNETRAKYPELYASQQLSGDLIFYLSGEWPQLPFKAHGEAWHTGWDISTKWAIDAAGVCWKDGAHGGAMHITDVNGLLMEFNDECEHNQIRAHLGLPPLEPSWMAAARAAGWMPPAMELTDAEILALQKAHEYVRVHMAHEHSWEWRDTAMTGIAKVLAAARLARTTT